MSTNLCYLRPEAKPQFAPTQATHRTATGVDNQNEPNQIPVPNQKPVPIDHTHSDPDQLDSTERQEVEELLNRIAEGNFNKLEELVTSYEFNPKRLAKIANEVRNVLPCSEVTIPYTPVARGQLTADDKIHDIVIFTIKLKSRTGFRSLSVATDRRYKTQVCGPPKDGSQFLSVPLAEDPKVLFQQIGRMCSLQVNPGPPPLTMSYN